MLYRGRMGGQCALARDSSWLQSPFRQSYPSHGASSTTKSIFIQHSALEDTRKICLTRRPGLPAPPALSAISMNIQRGRPPRPPASPDSVPRAPARSAICSSRRLQLSVPAWPTALYCSHHSSISTSERDRIQSLLLRALCMLIIAPVFVQCFSSRPAARSLLSLPENIWTVKTN
ncbi:hypothetical protein FA95DRAFT_545830 [Auriscalpium vulgare]|uniref:Uncharacterized protein n=1 Tax=Auriscalpium vulgare TaxID=40419 RepID=A0ACB8RG07_9AGAM|nr:hypothetical protein FA95DRAFT_545830 [Auriscalpium vulgare]